MKRICVVGLGTVGYPTALAISQAGFQVEGYDIDSSKKSAGSAFRIWSNWDDVPLCDVYVLCVPTGLKGAIPDVSAVLRTAKSIASKSGGRRVLVCIESTVSLGTCRLAAKSLRGNLLVHVPHRFWSKNPVKRGVRQRRVIGALDPDSMRNALQFYRRVGVPLTRVSSLEEAEMAKMVENSYRFVQIAFAEEMSLLCESLGISWDSVRRAANTKWNVEMPVARSGIYGCLPKDVAYLAGESTNRTGIISEAIEVDNAYKRIKGREKRSILGTGKRKNVA